jgi:hypothetical protein
MDIDTFWHSYIMNIKKYINDETDLKEIKQININANDINIFLLSFKNYHIKLLYSYNYHDILNYKKKILKWSQYNTTFMNNYIINFGIYNTLFDIMAYCISKDFNNNDVYYNIIKYCRNINDNKDNKKIIYYLALIVDLSLKNKCNKLLDIIKLVGKDLYNNLFSESLKLKLKPHMTPYDYSGIKLNKIYYK